MYRRGFLCALVQERDMTPRKSEMGPSYWDIGAWYTHALDRWGCYIKFEVTPPLRTRPGLSQHRAIVTLFVAPGRSHAKYVREGGLDFGSGAVNSTLPQAMMRLLIDWEERQEEKELAAKARSAF